MNNLTTHHVIIKGTKEGLVFLLNDKSTFEEIMEDLDSKLSVGESGFFQGPINHIHVHTGERMLTADEEEALRSRISRHGNLIIQDIRNDVKIDQEEASRLPGLRIITKTIRSGQVIEHDGTVLLLGDINPGGCLICHGDIYVLGTLRGLAHAGVEGNREAIVAASVMYPTQLRIADVISRPPEEWDEQAMEQEFAYLEGNEMKIDKINQLFRIRPDKETDAAAVLK